MKERKIRLEHLLEFKSIFEKQLKKIIFIHELNQKNRQIKENSSLKLDHLAFHELDTSIQLRLRLRELSSIKQIQKALHRISQGTFGECESCGEQIGVTRLQDKPTLTVCLNCCNTPKHKAQPSLNKLNFKGPEKKIRLV